MHLLLLIQLLLSLLVPASAIPVWHGFKQAVLLTNSQQSRRPDQVLYKPSSYLDVRPDAVVLALTIAKDEAARYFFLPVGKNVQTHSTTELPLHPLSAHIVGAVDSAGFVVQPEDMPDVECAIYPIRERPVNPRKKAEDFALRISTRNGVVNLTKAGGPSSLTGREVEAYECW